MPSIPVQSAPLFYHYPDGQSTLGFTLLSFDLTFTQNSNMSADPSLQTTQDSLSEVHHDLQTNLQTIYTDLRDYKADLQTIWL